MNPPEHTGREKEIFEQALDLPSTEARLDFVKGACGGDSGLLARVETLLRAHEATGNFLPARPGNATIRHTMVDLAEKPGTVIGRYKLLQVLGEGGCGTVYMAEQEVPVRRRVALKVIKLGMDTKAVIARFEAERQALAMMDHPNIAKVLDAGATETGRPYFVMELVRGLPITGYCDQHNLPMQDRLILFTQVCQAIQHAHQKGIIHRDIKPSNILVTLHDGVPVPKVIDFGIAKATLGRLTDQTVFTAFEQFIGTPAYMSPEQAEMSGLDIDTRSDIYSLGVLLYELLTGKPPFDPQSLMQAGLDEIRRLIREVEPPKPSTRLSTLAAADSTTLAKLRGTDPTKLSVLVRGDLDWIVMKALEKNRTRRYETAGAFAADIQRHLHNEPVTARPPSAGYLLQKLISRNRLAFVAAAAIAAALVIGLGVSTWAFIQEKNARQRAVAAEHEQVAQRQLAERARNEEAKQRALAEEARNNETRQRTVAEVARALAETNEVKAKTAALKSEQAFKFMARMLQGVGPSVAAGRDTALLRDILDKTVKRLDRDMKDQPEVDEKLRNMLAGVYIDLGDLAKAESLSREALAKSTALFGQNHLDVAEALVVLSMSQLMQGHIVESEPLMRQSLAILQKLPVEQQEDLPTAHLYLGTIMMTMGKLADAEAMLREAMAILEQHPEFDFENNKMGLAKTTMAMVLQQQGRLAESEPLMREAIVLQKQQLGNDHPMMAFSMVGLSNVLLMQDKVPEAETMFREAFVILKKAFGSEHQNVAMLLTNQGLLALRLGKLAEAETVAREAIALQTKVLGPDHPNTIGSRGLLSEVLQRQGKTDAAEAQLREAQASQSKRLGGGEQVNADAKANAALLAMRQGKWAEAETNLREALPVIERELGREHQNTLGGRLMLADAISWQNRPAESEAILREVVTDSRQAFGNKSRFVAGALAKLGRSLEAQDKLAETETCLREALAISKTMTTDSQGSDVADITLLLAMVRARLGDNAESRALAATAAAMAGQLPENNRNASLPALDASATSLKERGKFADEERVRLTMLEYARARDGHTSVAVSHELTSLATTLYSLGRFPESEATAREAVTLRRKLMPAHDWRIANVESYVGRSLVAQQKYPEAEPLLLSTFAELEKLKPTESPDMLTNWRQSLRDNANELAKLYQATSRPAKAAEWKAKADEYPAVETAVVAKP